MPELWELHVTQAELDDRGRRSKDEAINYFLIDQAGRILLGENEPLLPWYIGQAETKDGSVVIVDIFTDLRVMPGDLEQSGILNQYEYRTDLRTLTLLRTAESRMLLLDYNHPQR